MRFTFICFLTSVTFFFIPLISQGQGNSLLWKISGNGLKAPSYLYGTMHTKDSRVFHFADSVFAKFEACDAFAMEVVLNPEIQTQLMKSVMMDSGNILKNLITPDQYDSADHFCQRNLGYSVSFFDHIKPIYTSVILAQSVLNDTAKAPEHEHFLDEYFQRQAAGQMKQVFGLETVEEQMHVFDLIDYKAQAELMMQTIRTSVSDTLNLEGMIQLYVSNDLAGMMKFENDFKLPDTLYHSLFTERNLKMADRIDTLIKNRSVFIAVGAGHLGERNGLIELLRNKGYSVLPVLPSYNNYSADGWYKYHSGLYRFKVDFPSVPTKETGLNASTKNAIYRSTLSNQIPANFYVRIEEAQDIKNDPLQQVTLEPQSRLKALFGETIEIKTSNYTTLSQDFQFTWTEGRRVTGTIYQGDQHHYFVYCVYKKDVDKKKIKRFLDSFQIIP